MKVDFPQPESAATPMIIGVTPSGRAMFKLLELTGADCMFFGVNAEGAKAATEPKEKAAIERVNFILFILCFLN
jgi:hypothetical protein